MVEEVAAKQKRWMRERRRGPSNGKKGVLGMAADQVPSRPSIWLCAVEPFTSDLGHSCITTAAGPNGMGNRLQKTKRHLSQVTCLSMVSWDK